MFVCCVMLEVKAVGQSHMCACYTGRWHSVAPARIRTTLVEQLVISGGAQVTFAFRWHTLSTCICVYMRAYFSVFYFAVRASVLYNMQHLFNSKVRARVAKCMRRDHLKSYFNEFSFSHIFHVKFSTTFTRDTNERIKVFKRKIEHTKFSIGGAASLLLKSSVDRILNVAFEW